MKIGDFESFQENPFQKSLRPAIKHGWRTVDPDKAKQMVDMDSGETVFVSNHGNMKLLLKDVTEFTKVFNPAYSEMGKLSAPGLRMLTFILTLLKKDTDWVLIDLAAAMAWCHYESRTHIYSGLCNLMENKFICRKTGGNGEYYININYFFNGKRTELKYGQDLKERLYGDAKKGKLRTGEEIDENEIEDE